MNDLRETVAAGVKPRPDLAAGRDVLGYSDDAWDMGCAGHGQGTAEKTCNLDKPPAGAAHPRFHDLADIDQRLAAREAFAEPPPDWKGQGSPLLFRHQGAEAHIADLDLYMIYRRRIVDMLWVWSCFEHRHRERHDTVSRCYLCLPSGSRLTIRVPRRTSAASFGLGTVSIRAYKRSSIYTRAIISLGRLAASGWSLASCSACATQDRNASTAGSSSRSLRTAAMRMAISHRSVSASKCSRRSPLTGTRRIRFQAISSRIEVETFERASPSVAATCSAVRGRSDR